MKKEAEAEAPCRIIQDTSSSRRQLDYLSKESRNKFDERMSLTAIENDAMSELVAAESKVVTVVT